MLSKPSHLSATFEGLLDAAPDAIVTVDETGAIVLANAQTERIFGYPRDELLGQKVDLLIPERFRASHPARREAYAADPHTRPMGANLQLYGRRRDGSEFPVEISLSPVGTPDGVLVTSIIRDVTDRRRAEAQFRGLLESAPDAIVGADADGRITLVNAQAERLFGYTRTELLGQAVEMLIPDRARRGHGAHRRGYVANPHTRPMGAGLELHGRRKDGSEFPVEISLSPMDTEDGVVITAIIRDVTERKHVEQQLKHLADHDPLTGLANRRCFEARVDEALRQAARHGHGVAVLLLDIDDFKYVNDTRGHSFGDELIRSIAACLRDAVRETDLLARLGGDEFAVLITHAGEIEAVDAAGRLLTALRERGPRPTGRRVYVTASIGVAASDAQDTVADDLLVKADIAMYAAKDAGRNRWASFDPAWAEADNVRARGTWVERLRQALDGDGFTLFAQPMRSLTGDPLAHHELLVRMRDGAGGLAAPATFIGTAERFGLIQSLDRWVLRHAIEVAAQTTGTGAPRLSVNLSAKSLADAELPGMIGDVLAEHQVDPGRLILEITETAAIASMDDAIDFARTVRGLGCHLALDDFGAGFGSFSYVKHLPLDYLKIDGEFIHELSASHHNRLIVGAIVGIARGLGQKTVAEFVEDAHTMTLLQAAGVDYAQGFHVGRPRPVAEVFPTASPDPSRTRPLRG